MISLTRRQFVTGATLGCASTAATRASASSSAPRPKMLVHVLLRGGIDAMLSTDPKVAGEVSPRIPLPFPESAIGHDSGVRFGPLLSHFKPFMPRMAILNGITCSTVSHPAGVRNAHEMRHLYPRGASVGLAGTIGAVLRNGEPLDDIRIDLQGDHLRPSEPLTRTLILRDVGKDGPLQSLHALAQRVDQRRAIEDVLGREGTRCVNTSDCTSINAVGDLLRKMPHGTMPEVASIPSPSRGVDPFIANTSEGLWRDVLFILQNRLAKGIFVVPHHASWDSHQHNDQWQTRSMNVFGPPFAYFLDQLSRRRTTDGELLQDEVGIVVSSELGRFPIPNEFKGKDHLPEFPAILIGPRLRPGQYGQTDANTLSTPIELATGHSGSSKRTLVPDIDDLGATILHWFGIEEAASLGYIGRRLDFLLA